MRTAQRIALTATTLLCVLSSTGAAGAGWKLPRAKAVAAKAWPWRRLCPVLLHEYGHLAGYTDPRNPLDPHHSRNPNSIMWPFVHADRRCAGRGKAYLGGRPRR